MTQIRERWKACIIQHDQNPVIKLFHAQLNWEELLTAHKKQDILAFKLLGVFILLINVKMLTIIGIVTLISMINFKLS